MNNETITISKEEYFGLRADSMKLNLLECGGVDNWTWYGESLNPDGQDYEEMLGELHKEIFGE